MNQHVYDFTVTQSIRTLKGLQTCLVAARDFAKERGFDENTFLSLRIAPDMFPLVKQVQIASDIAKAAAGKLAGKTPPSFEDNETTLEELLSRLDRTVNYLSDFKPADFDKYTEQTMRFPWLKGFFLKGKDYFESHAVPNLYFHTTTTYILLRGAGVPIGKKNFLGEQNWVKE
jgi:uncharacterized protein